MFTDNAIEVCIKKFVHFLRKGFIKIITNISCLKPGEKEAEGQKAHDEKAEQRDVLTYLMPNMKNISSSRTRLLPTPGSAAILSVVTM